MNDLADLGPNMAHMNQKPENPFRPGDRVTSGGDNDSTAVVVEVLPPEMNVELYGQELDREAVRVAFPSALDEGSGDWRDLEPALWSSYCDDQDIKIYIYKHTNLEFFRVTHWVSGLVVKTFLYSLIFTKLLFD